jgi:energy-coupling factor transport system substrate-specific component
VATLTNSAIARFLLCGGSAALINWLARIALSTVMPFVPAVVLAYLVGMLAGFILYRSLVWPNSTTQNWQKQVAPFVVVNLIGAIVVLTSSLAIIAVGLMLRVPAQILEAGAHGIGIGVGAVFNYVGHNLVTFRAKV